MWANCKNGIFAQKSAEGEENKVSTIFSLYILVFVAKGEMAKDLKQLDKVFFLHISNISTGMAKNDELGVKGG